MEQKISRLILNLFHPIDCLIKMPKKHEIKYKVPENLEIGCVIGPLQIRKCGNSGHVIVPHRFIGRKMTYVIICKERASISEIFGNREKNKINKN